MRVVVLVHPGSHFGPGACEVDPARHQQVTRGIRDDLLSADGLVVIDGSLSDILPGWFEVEVRAGLMRAEQAECPAFRIWGCDSGEPPVVGWQPHGNGIVMVSDGQVTAAGRVSAFLPGADEILVTGAWATRDDSSGCVNSVAHALRDRLPGVEIRVSENALFEEYMAEVSDELPANAPGCGSDR